MANKPVNNDIGSPVPKMGAVKDMRHSSMSFAVQRLSNPAKGKVGGVGSGSGVVDGGRLGSNASPRKKH